MSLKSLEILAREETVLRVADAGRLVEEKLRGLTWPLIREVRGRGLMWGVELKENAGPLLARLLQKGLIFLADGPQGNVLSFTPPFIMTGEEMDFALAGIAEAL